MKKSASFRKVFERLLGRKLTGRDGLPEKANWPAMPEKLREFYRVVGREDSINRAFERLCRPTRMEAVAWMRMPHTTIACAAAISVILLSAVSQPATSSLGLTTDNFC
jgi:hypothetical protein